MFPTSTKGFGSFALVIVGGQQNSKPLKNRLCQRAVLKLGIQILPSPTVETGSNTVKAQFACGKSICDLCSLKDWLATSCRITRPENVGCPGCVEC